MVYMARHSKVCVLQGIGGLGSGSWILAYWGCLLQW